MLLLIQGGDLKIGLVVPWEETTPPRRYGGIELVVHNLALRLTEQGHKVTVFATADSKTEGHIVPIFPKATRRLPQSTNKIAREAYTFLGISRVIEHLRTADLDIIHNHLGWRFLIFQNMVKQPIVTTLHLNLDNPYEQEIYRLASNHSFVSISHSQRQPLPELNYVENIYNGIRIDKFSSSNKPGKYLAFLGSFTAHKGPDKAIKIAKAARKPLIMAGKIDPMEQKYFDHKIRPHIDGKQIKFIGEIGHYQKNILLKNAEALLMPISWREPFGLVMAEALACGTPVVAIRRGATPEVIEHGKTGFLCRNILCMIRCTRKISEIDRALCRQVAEERFTAKRMAEEYVEVYKKVIKTKRTKRRL